MIGPCRFVVAVFAFDGDRRPTLRSADNLDEACGIAETVARVPARPTVLVYALDEGRLVVVLTLRGTEHVLTEPS